MTVALAFDVPPTYSAYLVGRILSALLPREKPSAKTSPSIRNFSHIIDAPAHDPWLDETLAQIERFRFFTKGWDEAHAQAPDRARLETAEYLTAFLAQWPQERRPSLALDGFGRPTFASKIAGFYLHLTVDAPGILTWYSLVEGEEFFEDDVPFDGLTMPSGLESLSAKRFADDM